MKRLRPGDLITFSGLIGQDRGPCLVLAVVPFKGFTKLLVLTNRARLRWFEIADGSILANGIERVNIDL